MDGNVSTTYLTNGVKTVELEANGTPIGHGSRTLTVETLGTLVANVVERV